jgi:deazaflavin-dependent oxidoreductase (nitroreductase family)
VISIWREMAGDEIQKGSLFRSKPAGLLRLLFRLPVYVYRVRLGWLFGHRFLLLTHRGRKTGRIRQTVLEVVLYDAATGESTVVSAWGERAEWYRNLRAAPALEVQTGWRRYRPVQRFLSHDEAAAAFTEYERLHPLAARCLTKLFKGQDKRSEGARRASIASLPMISFRPPDNTWSGETPGVVMIISRIKRKRRREVDYRRFGFDEFSQYSGRHSNKPAGQSY